MRFSGVRARLCPEDIDRETPIGNSTGGAVITYLEPLATDNSGVVTIDSRSHTPGLFFNTGITQVVYVFVDPTGNSATCSFSILVREGKLKNSGEVNGCGFQ